MRGLTLTLPWPYLIAAAERFPLLGKSWETRDWAPQPPSWRGEIAIHAAQNLKPVGGKDGLLELCAESPFREALAALDLAGVGLLDPSMRGVIVAVAEFGGAGVACEGYEGVRAVPAVRWPDGSIVNVPEPELSFGDYSPGRRIWRLDRIKALATPVPCRGALGLWAVPHAIEAEIRGQL